MSVKIYSMFLLAVVAVASAVPLQQYQYDSEEAYEPVVPGIIYHVSPEEAHRVRRSLQPGAPNIFGSNQPQQDGGWSLNPNLGRDENGNTRGNVAINHKGKDHDFNAGWDKVIRGPNRAKPTWHVGGSIRW